LRNDEHHVSGRRNDPQRNRPEGYERSPEEQIGAAQQRVNKRSMQMPKSLLIFRSRPVEEDGSQHCQAVRFKEAHRVWRLVESPCEWTNVQEMTQELRQYRHAASHEQKRRICEKKALSKTSNVLLFDCIRCVYCVHTLSPFFFVCDQSAREDTSSSDVMINASFITLIRKPGAFRDVLMLALLG
jgi:hypothetical protein